MSTNLTLSQACEGMLHYKQAAGLSPNTIADYRVTFKKLHLFFDQDPQFAGITRAQLIDFFAWLQKDYVSEPAGVAPRGKIRLSAKSVLNTHVNLSSLWHWAVDEGYVETNLIRKIHAPEVTAPVIETFIKEEIELLLKACSQTRNWKTKPQTASNRSTAMRDRALILVLTDTGLRRRDPVVR